MRILFLVLFTIVSLALSPTTSMARSSCVNDPVCDGFHNPGSASPAVDGMVCIWFSQKQAGNVQLILYTKEGGSITYQHTGWKGQRDKFCIGGQRLNGVAWLMVCNDYGRATRGVPSITRLKQTGQIDVCQLSSQGCN